MAQDDVFLQTRPAQVQVAILKTGVFVSFDIVADLERQRFGSVFHHQLADHDFDVAGIQARVFHARRAQPHRAAHRQHKLAAHLFCCSISFCRILRNDDLGHAVAVAQVDKDDIAMIAAAIGPAVECDLPAVVGRAQVAAGKSSFKHKLMQSFFSQVSSTDYTPACRFR